MAAIVPDNWGYQYPVWNDTKEWKAETVVQYANDAAGKPLYWVALVDNVAEVPAEGFDLWEKYNILSDYLERLTRNGICTAVQTFTQKRGWIRKQRTYWNVAHSLMVRTYKSNPTE